MRKRIGVLGLQGAVVEHERAIRRVGQLPVVVRYPGQLEEIDGIILPGGESTTMGKILRREGLLEPLREKIEGGLPVWGTCAGMILLAKELENDPTVCLGVMDITVRRNAYGSQIDSFSVEREIPEVAAGKVELVFIRAPYVTRVGRNVRALCEMEGHVVAAREGNMLATSFHPELTDDTAFMDYFTRMLG